MWTNTPGRARLFLSSGGDEGEKVPWGDNQQRNNNNQKERERLSTRALSERVCRQRQVGRAGKSEA